MNADHPMWRVLNLAVILAFVTGFSALNATTFDETELKMITQLVIALGGWEVAKAIGVSKMKDEK